MSFPLYANALAPIRQFFQRLYGINAEAQYNVAIESGNYTQVGNIWNAVSGSTYV
jgi:hypothetical protein